MKGLGVRSITMQETRITMITGTWKRELRQWEEVSWEEKRKKDKIIMTIIII